MYRTALLHTHRLTLTHTTRSTTLTRTWPLLRRSLSQCFHTQPAIQSTNNTVNTSASRTATTTTTFSSTQPTNSNTAPSAPTPAPLPSFATFLAQPSHTTTTASNIPSAPTGGASTLIQRINAFWFADYVPGTIPSRSLQQLWFTTDPALDNYIKTQFEDDFVSYLEEKENKANPESETGTPYSDLEKTPEGLLSLIILCDRLSQRIYRNTPWQYAFTALPNMLCFEACMKESEYKVDHVRRIFFLLPMLSEEDKNAPQVAWSRAYEVLHDAPRLLKPFIRHVIGYIEAHQFILNKFGRYPTRNALLGRESTLEELQYLSRHPLYLQQQVAQAGSNSGPQQQATRSPSTTVTSSAKPAATPSLQEGTFVPTLPRPMSMLFKVKRGAEEEEKQRRKLRHRHDKRAVQQTAEEDEDELDEEEREYEREQRQLLRVRTAAANKAAATQQSATAAPTSATTAPPRVPASPPSAPAAAAASQRAAADAVGSILSRTAPSVSSHSSRPPSRTISKPERISTTPSSRSTPLSVASANKSRVRGTSGHFIGGSARKAPTSRTRSPS